MPDLFTLTADELEKMIGDVVREPGFLDLLEKIESLWRIRAFIGR
jgi:hypothetical protein